MLPYFHDTLTQQLIENVEASQVDLQTARNDTGNFLFLNLETMEAKFRIPPNKRYRIKREVLRSVLLGGITDHIHWGKRLDDIKTIERGVTATFTDGTTAEGRVLVGADGCNSSVRRWLLPETHRSQRIPVDVITVCVAVSADEAKPIRNIDPLLFQGVHPRTGNYLWVSIIDTPDSNGTAGTDHEIYHYQVSVSWLSERGDGIPETAAGRVAAMKIHAEGFHPVLRRLVDSIPDDAPAQETPLREWGCLPWDNRNGLVTLAGDAAHAMSMYRGEGANHGLLDAFVLCHAMKQIYSNEKSQKEALHLHEQEMRERVVPSIRLSRDACIEAHDFDGLNENSAILRRRALKGLPQLNK